ncbi:DUF1795 domain-containing protein [Scandinavium goeteborgense]|jgi:hypothetical protein|uniref:DUF1795 domain-containing protein n=1 Tax=Scandinavium goeteborgense TaxID=1851514 RepID=UPI0037F4CA7E
MQKNNRSYYYIQEGKFEFPDGFTDRSVNLFVKGKPGAAFALNIARDFPKENETLGDYVGRQIGILKDNLKNYEVKVRQQIEIGQNKIPGEYVEATYMAETRRVWQRQVAILLGAQALIFTATNAAAFNKQQHALWEEWIHSFTSRDEEAGHV